MQWVERGFLCGEVGPETPLVKETIREGEAVDHHWCPFQL